MHPFSHLMINIIDTLHIQKEQITGYYKNIGTTHRPIRPDIISCSKKLNCIPAISWG